jgi:hypothetical protein
MCTGFCERHRKFSRNPDLGKHDFTGEQQRKPTERRNLPGDRGGGHQLTQARKCEGPLFTGSVAPVKDRNSNSARSHGRPEWRLWVVGRPSPKPW